MNTLDTAIQEVIKFRDERDWQQFHNSKDLALAISIEAAELTELFLWKDPEDVEIGRLKEELADVLTFIFILAHKHNIDIPAIVMEKLRASGLKYPVDKSKGNAKKYNEL